MKYEYIIQEQNPRLLLFFAGWASDPTPFRHYRPKDRDFIICYDYRTLEHDFLPPGIYQKIDVVGWSMGVWAASHIGPQLGIPIGHSIALNGTPFPIDAELGIHPDIWQGTLDNLSPAPLHKFCRRMCLDSNAFHQFLRITPRRPVEELAEEMRSIEKQRLSLLSPTFHWEKAIVGSNDRIIPPGNQCRTWQMLNVPFYQTEDAHYSEPMFHQYLEEVWRNN